MFLKLYSEMKLERLHLQECQVATNFIAYHDLNIGEGFSEFDSYDMAIFLL